MKIAIISGSHRANSESERVAHYLEQELKAQHKIDSYLLKLAENPLPFWDEELGSEDSKWNDLWKPISKELTSAEGVIVVSPEWGGMVPSGLKNFFLLCSKNELAHKPGMIVAVSSGLGGAYPIAELRMSSYKNTHLCYIPDHLIIRTAPKMLGDGAPADKHDESLRKRITYSLQMLVQYTKALNTVRASGVVNLKDFPFGM